VDSMVLITGCYRSGTTLAEKLLNSHAQVIVGSQPFPVLYFAAKRRFLEQRGLKFRYPLDHLFGETRYSPRTLCDYLDSYRLDESFIDALFDGLEAYTKGLWTPEILTYRHRLRPGTFFELFCQFLGFISEIFPKESARMVGAKEILVEEMAECLGQRGVRIVYVVRDPRDMITSLNFRDRDNLTGENRPVLFSIRAWRKSVALALQAEEAGYGTVIRYEDLTTNTAEAMGKVTRFLGLPSLDRGVLEQPIRDQWGKVWGGNSSFEDKRGVSTSSIGTYRRKMPETVIRYVESCCLPEMRLLGYELEFTETFDADALASFRTPFASIHELFPRDYSSEPQRVAQEVRRYELLINDRATLSPEDIQRWFLRSAAYSRLRNVMRGSRTEYSSGP